MPSDHRRDGPSAAVGRVGLLAASLAWFVLIAVPALLVGVRVEVACLLALLLTLNTLAGGYVWLRVRGGSASLAELIGAGIGLGLVAIPIMAALGYSPLTRALAWGMLPIVAACVWLASRGRSSPRVEWDPPTLVASALAPLIALWLYRGQVENYLAVADGDFTAGHPDMLFFQMVSQGLASSGAAGGGNFSDLPFRYHWFSYMWSGTLEAAAGVPPIYVVAIVLPAVSIVAVGALAAAWTRHLTASRWVPIVAASLATVGRFVADSSGITVNWESPSQTASLAILLFAALMTTWVLRNGVTASRVLLLALMTVSLAGTKISTSFVLLAGLGVLTLAGIASRATWHRRALAVTGIALAATLVGFLLTSYGNLRSGFLVLRPIDVSGGLSEFLNSFSVVPGTVPATLLSLIPGWIALMVWSVRRPWSTVPEKAFGLGLGLGGLLPLFLLEEARPNNIYFLAAATALVWSLSAVGTAETSRGLIPDHAARRRVLIAGFIGAAVLALAWGALVSQPALENVQPQVLALALWAALSIAMALAMARGVGIARGFLTLLLVMGTLSPLTMILAERVFPIKVASGTSSALDTSGDPSDPSSPSVPGVSSQALISMGRILDDNSDAGDIVAFRSPALVPALYAGQLRPYFHESFYLLFEATPGPSDPVLEQRNEAMSAMDSRLAEDTVGLLCTDDVSFVILPSAGAGDQWVEVLFDDGEWTLGRLTCDEGPG